MGGDVQAVVENHQTYFIDRKSWFAKKVFPEKVDLDVTTTVSSHPVSLMLSLQAKICAWCLQIPGNLFLFAVVCVPKIP
jgi:hypothetical protein